MTKFTLLDCQEIAIAKKGKCLSFFCKGKKQKMRWECKNGHQWDMKLEKVKNGEWCEQCRVNSFKRLLTAYLVYNNIIYWN